MYRYERAHSIGFSKHIRDAAQTAIEFLAGRPLAEFASDKKSCFAVVRALEIVGEAAKHIPSDMRERHPAVPWKSLAGIRDKLVHDYVSADHEIVWRTVVEDLPALIPQIEQVLASEAD